MMKCSHGLRYEVKCTQCFNEAMARVGAAKKVAAVNPSEQQGLTTLFVNGVRVDVQEELDSIQGLS
jgi:hypothetical protein